MALITITITDSDDEIISGIPEYIDISTDIPSTIFYTLDGSTPNSSSSVYVNVLYLPTDMGDITLKVFATNGVDASSILTALYGPNISGVRRQYDTVTNVLDLTNVKYDSFPYSDIGPRLPSQYGDTGLAIVDLPGTPGYSIGFDGTGTGTSAGETDLPPEQLFHDSIFSETNEYGETGHGIGTLPIVTDDPIVHPEDQEEAFVSSRALFDARARVIYQDNTKPNPRSDIKNINRPHFSLENPLDRDGSRYMNYDANSITGSFVRAELDEIKGTMTFYYYDNIALRWIISTEPYDYHDCPTRNLSRIIFPSSRNPGMRSVFQWIPFKYTRLY
jgi:hypothetical protein